jgi:hypothetical protein
MKRTVLYLAVISALGGCVMMIVGVNSRELNTALVGYGALLAVVSSLVAFITRIVIGQRGA